MTKTPLIVSGIIFALIALLHLSRAFIQFPLSVNNYPIPLWVNYMGFVVFGLLSYWMFRIKSDA